MTTELMVSPWCNRQHKLGWGVCLHGLTAQCSPSLTPAEHSSCCEMLILAVPWAQKELRGEATLRSKV